MLVRWLAAAALIFALSTVLGGCRLVADRAQATVGQHTAFSLLRQINAAQARYSASHGHYACTLAELGSQYGLIDRDLSYGEKNGYSFSLSCTTRNDEPAYQVWASPLHPDITGSTLYCSDATGFLGSASHVAYLCTQPDAIR